MESLEGGIVPEFLLDTECGNGIMWDILHVCILPVESGIVDRGRNRADTGVFFALNLMKPIQ